MCFLSLLGLKLELVFDDFSFLMYVHLFCATISVIRVMKTGNTLAEENEH